jgi:competence protein ComEA
MQRVVDIVIGLLIGLLMAGLIFYTSQSPKGEPVTLMPTPTARPIVVYLSGAVQRPGVYSLPGGSRMSEAIIAAGGLMEGADIKDVNLAQLLEDGQKININAGEGAVVPTPGLTISGSGIATSVPVIQPSGLINLNTAGLQELIDLPGIGPSTAQLILNYRQENGPFTQVEDLLNIPGIGAATVNTIRPYVTVTPP